MKTLSRIGLPLVMLVGLSACASERGWTPTVDAARDPNAARLQTDLSECKYYADRAANTNETLLEDTGVGVVGGAAGGAAIGAVAGNPAAGAAIGAVGGAGAGLGGGLISSDERFRHAYIHCMKERGHPVVN